MTARILLNVLLLIAATPLLIGGCVSDGGDYPTGGSDDGSNPDTVNVPKDAIVAAQGVGELSFVSDSDGRIYAYDDDRNRVIYFGNVKKGQKVVLTPDKNTVTVAGNTVSDDDLKSQNRHKIYLERHKSSSGGSGTGGSGSDNTFGGGAITVPKSAEIVREGTGDLSWRADRDGVVYLFDVDTNTAIFKSRIKSGQRFTAAPAQDSATLDGKSVFKGSMNPKHKYKVYFDKERV